ncbi:type III-A CRISPR-associated RAMP protein Csm4 [Olsenella uli]|uniref:type III-A CRISPR-associated RAMP protein Csm4 n=1 Tax=Olsenella uli TaxID=133926 RepID=UPI0028D7B637|nr:type III-A CRISPR-associated RAMP protein Csm4 [Olsenella uli]
MSMRIIKLSFTAPVHFGTTRLSDANPTLDAGALFSAMYIEALKMGCAEELLAAVRSDELCISDGFPYAGSILYLPKPMLRSKRAESESVDSRARKAAKKLDFIAMEHLRSYFEGTMDPIGEYEAFDIGSATVRTKVNLTHERKPDAEPYHIGSFTYNQGAGMYFIVDGGYSLEPILEQLQYSGVGGERSSGYGRFTFTTENFAEFNAGAGFDASLYVLLSTSTPRDSELSDRLLNSARYKLIRRGGFVESTTHHAVPQKKRDLYLFAAGSTFSSTFNGDIFDVNATSGGHPVYRYAKAMLMEMRA